MLKKFRAYDKVPLEDLRRSSRRNVLRVVSMHQNTLRYRLEQFASLTGADLAETETIIEVWWALEFWAVRRTADGQT